MIEQRSIAGEWKRLAVKLERADDLDALVAAADKAKVVLLGEASHGTSEFYTWRAEISRRLIGEHGFSFIAVEGDWPSCYELNRYIKGRIPDTAANQVLQDAFNRWPSWMWANWEIAAFAEWLKGYNDTQPESGRIGFYGLDMYSLWESLEAVVAYLEQRSPEEAEAAKEAFRCFQPYGRDEQSYGATAALVGEHCRDEVVRMLGEIRGNRKLYEDDAEGAFNAEQNARVAVQAERYYRAMMTGGPESWNIRDRHMAETLDELLKFHGPEAKVVVWEHNTHIGDARATDMAEDGMVNVGQLMRERLEPGETFAVGFTTYTGTVIAGSRWGAPHQVMRVPEGRPGSWERYMHEACPYDHYALLGPDAGTAMRMPIGHRAIGVVYHPAYEAGNYVPTVLPERYDAVVHIDESRALHPLAGKGDGDGDGPPELYPWGM